MSTSKSPYSLLLLSRETPNTGAQITELEHSSRALYAHYTTDVAWFFHFVEQKKVSFKTLRQTNNEFQTQMRRKWAQVLVKDNQFLFLIKHPSCYSYSQGR